MRDASASNDRPVGRAALERLRRVRTATLALVRGVPQERLDRRPAPDRWSPGEILDHLILADRLYRRDLEHLFELARAGERPVVRRGFDDFNPSVLFFPKALLPLLEPPLALLNAILPDAFRDAIGRARWIPAQNPDAAEPRRGRPGRHLQRELEESLAATETLFQGSDALDLAAMEHYHPLLGRRDLDGLLRFIADHEERHQAQLREALGSDGGGGGETGGGPGGPGGGGDGGDRRPAPDPAPIPAESGRLDTSSFVVLGEGLAAGMVDFTLHEGTQRESFPARMAAAMGRPLRQPLFRAPGVGESPGFGSLPVRLPAPLQSTVLDGWTGWEPLAAPFGNLSVPGLTLAEVLERRPSPPLVRRDDPTGSALNFVVGLAGEDGLLGSEEGPAPTPVEAALRREPTFALVALGYAEALSAVTAADPDLLPSAEAFGADLDRLLGRLGEAGAQVLVTTVPDPLDTAYAASLDAAARVVRVEPHHLENLYGLAADDLVTVHGLQEIGFQILSGRWQELSERATLAGSTAEALRRGIAGLGDRVRELAKRHEAPVYDLHGLFRRVADAGVRVGGRRLTADFLGGFYSLPGYWPGAAGHAVIAAEIVELLNQTYDARFAPVDGTAVAAADPVADFRPAPGPKLPADRLPCKQGPEPDDRPVPTGESAGVADEALEAAEATPSGPLELPEGRVQTLPLATRASYFGDGIRAVCCREEGDRRFGSCAELLFGGLALVDSPLEGEITVRFDPPEDGVARFEIDFGGGFTGRDAVLATPRLFRMPFRRARVDPVPGTVSSGKLHLATGEVTDLRVFARYDADALRALVSVNPGFPRQPLSFPGEYGSAWARFEQRADGLLDFTFYGSTFVPLGSDVRWPLPFAGADGAFATVPAPGTAMHPHLSLSTKEPPTTAVADVPELPENTILELPLLTHNASFGDRFDLAVPALGGPATGRSHLLGRLEIQLGERTGDLQPFAVASLGPGGLLAGLPDSPLTESFPGRLYRGPSGFDELLRFPLSTYFLDGVYILDDPFDLSLGLLDRTTGCSVGEVLHRGFIGQDLIFALLRVEPRTPRDSFLFRGPVRFEKGPAGQTLFRFRGEVRVPYPPGFAFPQPDLSAAFVVEAPSALDPFFWLRAVHDEEAGGIARGAAEEVRASNGERFSYSFELAPEGRGEDARFEYVNHSQDGRFSLHRLAWVDVARAAGGSGHDTVTFTGWGTWRKDGVVSRQPVCVQVSSASGAEYVGIQVGLGAVSNVNTKPFDLQNALP